MTKLRDQNRVVLPAPRSQPRVCIQLLGTFGLTVNDHPVSLPTGAQRLVAVLALRGRMGRSRLAGLLWPETTEPRALASLRTGIWRVNQVANGLVNSGQGTVELCLLPSIDVAELIAVSRTVLDGAESSIQPSAESPGPLPVPLVAPGEAEVGELLADWDDPWLEQERERLRQLRLHVLEATAAQLTRSGRYGLALESALAALRIDELRESAYRSVMAIHLEEGNFCEAQRTFERCRQTFLSELGIEPSSEVRDMVSIPAQRSALTAQRGAVLTIHTG